MAGGLEFVLKLKDGLTGPAQKMVSSLSGLQGALGSVGNAVSGVESTFQTLSGSIVGDIARKAGELVVAGAKLAIDASSFKEDSIQAFKSLLGSQEAAAEVFDRVDKLAGDLGIDDHQAVAQLRKLLASGFNADTALGVVKAAADLAAARGQESADAFTNLISTIEAKDKFDVGAINKLAKAGVRAEDIYAQLAKTLHKTVPEVQAMVKAGQIDAATGVAAATAAVEGKFGGAGEEAANTFSRLLARVKDALGDLFQDVDLTPLKDALKTLLTVLNGPAGGELKDGISHFFGTIFKIVGEIFSGPEGQARLEKTLHSAARAFEKAAEILEKTAPIIIASIGFTIDALNTANDGVDTLGDIGRAVIDFGEALFAFGEILVMLPIALLEAIWNAITGAADAISGAGDTIGTALDDLSSSIFGDAQAAGTSVVDGIAEGIASGAGAVYAAISNLGSSLLATFMASIGAHSPSEDFKWAADFIPQGAAEGIAANDAPSVAAADMLDAASVSAVAQQNAAGASGAPAGGSTITNHNTFIVNGNDKAEMRRVILETLEAAAGIA